MKRFSYDFHVHSCLSPCAEDDNTPNNLAGMAHICGIEIMALTDHNTCKNCPAFFEAADRYGVIPIAGAEITTSEDIHLIALFEELEDALDFDAWLSEFRAPFPNRTDIYGEQLIMNGEDKVIGTEQHFLPIATALDIESAVCGVESFGGVCYPAHIDRQANGLISVLGAFPEKPRFSCAELFNADNISLYSEKYGLSDKLITVSSDAHRLTDLHENNACLLLDSLSCDAVSVRAELFKKMRREL